MGCAGRLPRLPCSKIAASGGEADGRAPDCGCPGPGAGDWRSRGRSPAALPADRTSGDGGGRESGRRRPRALRERRPPLRDLSWRAERLLRTKRLAGAPASAGAHDIKLEVRPGSVVSQAGRVRGLARCALPQGDLDLRSLGRGGCRTAAGVDGMPVADFNVRGRHEQGDVEDDIRRACFRVSTKDGRQDGCWTSRSGSRRHGDLPSFAWHSGEWRRRRSHWSWAWHPGQCGGMEEKRFGDSGKGGIPSPPNGSAPS